MLPYILRFKYEVVGFFLSILNINKMIKSKWKMLCMVHKITAFHGTISIYSIHQDRGMQSRLQMRHNIIAYLMEV